MDVSTPKMTVNSASNLVFPVYKNLRRRPISMRQMTQNRKNIILKDVIDGYRTTAVKRGDATYIFDTQDVNKRGPNKGKLRPTALLFVLRRKFNIPKKIDFINQFKTKQPEYVNRAKGMLDRAVRGIEKGYLKAE